MSYPTKKLSEVVEQRTEKNIKNNIPYIGMEDIESDTGRFLGSLKPKSVKSLTSFFDDSCVLYGKLRPYLNKVFIPNFEGHCSTEFIPLKPNINYLTRKWLAYWIMSPDIVKKVMFTVAGARMPRANMNRVIEFPIPLPPLEIQKKIVERIEKMMAKIDEAKKFRKEALADASALIPSALNKIFEEGKKKGWEDVKVGDVCEKPQYGYTESAKLEAVGPKFLRITDIQNGNVDWKNVPYCFCNDIEKYQLKNGDIVFARTGATVGKSYLIKDSPKNAIFASYLIRLRATEKTLPDFLYYFFQSPDYWRQITQGQVGGAQPNVNGTKLAKIKFPLPPFPEQKKIVKYLDSLSEKIRKIQSIQSSSEKELKLLEKGILSEAFGG